MTIWGLQVQDKDQKATALELVLEGQRAFLQRFGFAATHAQVSDGAEIEDVEGLTVTKHKHVRPFHAIVGIPTMANSVNNLKDKEN